MRIDSPFWHAGLLLAAAGSIALAAVRARADDITCTADSPRLTHCFDTRTGEIVSTTEHGEGGYSHTRFPDGRELTTWDHQHRIDIWQTSPPTPKPRPPATQTEK